jgi:ATP-binding cassette subfamily F protein uup
VKFLSGGERNRLLLARLFARPANLIVLDEPTNDLDTETLELLEERLVEYPGTLLVVSHDRAFLNNVVTSTIVFEHGNVREYVGGYDDWVRQRPQTAASSETRAPAKARTQPPRKESSLTRRRLAYHEKRELESLPETIESLESQLAELHEVMARPEFYKQASDEIAGQQARLKRLTEQLGTAYVRWEQLEALE